MTLSAEALRRIEEFVRPLYVGLDGAEGFSRVDHLRDMVKRLRGDEEVDATVLELLILFHGVADRLGSFGRDSRFELFVRGLDLPPGSGQSLREGLARFRERPASPEEALVHDALLLQETGVRAVVERLLHAGRRRRPLDRAVAALDAGPAPERFVTARGARHARAGRRAAERWIEQLRRSLSEETVEDDVVGRRPG